MLLMGPPHWLRSCIATHWCLKKHARCASYETYSKVVCCVHVYIYVCVCVWVLALLNINIAKNQYTFSVYECVWLCMCVCVCVYVRTPQGFAFSVRFLLNKNDASQARTGHKALRPERWQKVGANTRLTHPTPRLALRGNNTVNT